MLVQDENGKVTENGVYKIPAYKISALESELEKLNRRAEKIGCTPVAYEILGTEYVPDPSLIARYVELHGCKPEVLKNFPHVEVHNIRINGQGPKIEGHKFLGTLDHITLPGSVVVNCVPGEQVPPQFYNATPVCDHCGKNRRRNDTFVLENEKGEYIQVGRNCIKDFFGHDPVEILRFLSRIFAVMEAVEKDELFTSARMPLLFDKTEVLEKTAACIRTFGWKSRKAAEFDPTSEATAEYVFMLLMPAFTKSDQEAKKAIADEIKPNKKVDEREAKGALKWLNEQTPGADNSYMHNLQAVAKAEYVPAKMLGYWCSLIATYQRAINKLEEQKRENRINEYLGGVGERIETTVKCTFVHFTEGFYGPVTIYKMLTEKGHTLTWFYSGESGRKMEQGERYKIRGRVKKHEEYNGWKQTVMTRVTVKSA